MRSIAIIPTPSIKRPTVRFRVCVAGVSCGRSGTKFQAESCTAIDGGRIAPAQIPTCVAHLQHATAPIAGHKIATFQAFRQQKAGSNGGANPYNRRWRHWVSQPIVAPAVFSFSSPRAVRLSPVNPFGVRPWKECPCLGARSPSQAMRSPASTASKASSARGAWVRYSRRATFSPASAWRSSGCFPSTRPPPAASGCCARRRSPPASIIPTSSTSTTWASTRAACSWSWSTCAVGRCPTCSQSAGRLDPEELITLLVPAMRGVHAAHMAGVMHRDLKPENIILSESDGHIVPKVVDFGVSKHGGHQRHPALVADAHGRAGGHARTTWRSSRSTAPTRSMGVPTSTRSACCCIAR